MLNIDAEDTDPGPASIEQAYKDALANHIGMMIPLRGQACS